MLQERQPCLRIQGWPSCMNQPERPLPSGRVALAVLSDTEISHLPQQQILYKSQLWGP